MVQRAVAAALHRRAPELVGQRRCGGARGHGSGGAAVAGGAADRAAVVEHTLSVFARKFSFFVAEIDRMDVLFEAHFSTHDGAGGVPFSRYYLLTY